MAIATFLLTALLLSALKAGVSQGTEPAMAKPDCNNTCGDVTIPFPFGIGPNCSLDSWFEIECKATPYSNGSPKPFLSKFHIEVLMIGLSGGERTSDLYYTVTVRMPPLNVCAAKTGRQQLSSIDLRGSPYNFSTYHNVLVMQGCPGSVVLVNQSGNIMGGCANVCDDNSGGSFSSQNCLGVQCCKTRLSPDATVSIYASPLQFYNIDFTHQSARGRQNCLAAALVKDDYMKTHDLNLSTSNSISGPPVVLLWSWKSSIPPNTHMLCFHVRPTNFSHCYCDDISSGNPYLSNGCQVVEQCKDCLGRRGSFCYRNYSASDEKSYYCRKVSLRSSILGISIICIGGILFIVGCYGLYRFIKRRREMKRRAMFFKRNGGLLLQQQLSTNEGVGERTQIFGTIELEKATDYFNENRILGQGGQGTVYKGMLSDGRIVAIKKSKLVEERQVDQFINELAVLSQVNHRNVVKLLGCCLETEVPLLVYEFIPNGTLSERIHDANGDLFIGWEMRLKIAADSAGAIAYLHSSSSVPIYHRDIKSSNILLDEKYKAKVSDFGSSKTIAIDQTHLTTLVQGTMGYLDPEYFQSYQFTEKSDVYSFGVVLLELLTGKKPIYRSETMEPKNLVIEFLSLMDNSGLSSLLDSEIVTDAKEEELMAVVELTRRCLSQSGRLRPTMKEVAMTLEMIIKSPSDQDSAWDLAAMPKTSNTETEFMSNPLLGDCGSPLYTDVQPLLPYTM